VHLLVTPTAANDISLLFQGVGRHFVPYINKTYHFGPLPEGVPKGMRIF
jgi:putative transposase